jgi:GH24 family phage-related lysozyme (muramidase)
VNLSRLHASIRRHEGYRAEPYRDTRGFWTVGFGHLIHHRDLRQYAPHRTLGELLNALSDTDAHERWFREDVARAESDAVRYIGPAWHVLTDARREVLTEMAFQLGGRTLNQFVRLREAIIARNWVRAEAEMLASRWHDQTPRRAKALAARMLEG